MPWFKVDDGFHGHPKVVELSLEAVGVWTLAGSWCASYLTDGEINLKSIRRMGGAPEHATELIDAGLWIDQGSDTYQFKDWAEYQPLKEHVEAERAASRERMQRVRSKKKGTATPDGSEDVRPNNTRTFTRSSEDVRVTPTQSHPIPTPPPNGGGSAARGEHGTRIPQNFTATPEMIAWALTNTPNVNHQQATQKFKAHYRSQAGPQQFKTDWVAAWESWLLSDQQRASQDGPKTAAERRLDISRQNALKLSQGQTGLEITA